MLATLIFMFELVFWSLGVFFSKVTNTVVNIPTNLTGERGYVCVGGGVYIAIPFRIKHF